VLLQFCLMAGGAYGWYCFMPTQLVDLMSCLVAARSQRPTCRVYPLILVFLLTKSFSWRYLIAALVLK